MRITCLFVSLAITLVAHSDSRPIAGLPALPVLAHEENFIDGVAKALRPEVGRNVLITTKLTGDGGIIHDDSIMGEVAGSLRRRQALADLEELSVLGNPDTVAPMTSGLTSKLASATNGINIAGPVINHTTVVEDLPLLGNFKGIAPATAGITSNLGNLAGGHPQALLKRDTELVSLPGLGSLPSKPGFPSWDSWDYFPSMSSLPSVSALPGFSSLPSMSSLSPGSFPGINSIPQLGSKLGMAKYSMKPFPGIMNR